MTPTKKRTTKKKIVAPPSNLYRNIALTFIVAVAAIVGIVLYFSLSGVEISIKPKREVVTAELSIDARGTPAEGEIRGVVKESSLEKSQNFILDGSEGTIIDVPAQGSVTITNNSYKDQTLVKTTRLLSPEGKLFRLSKTVVVPSHGTVESDIYADELGASGVISPTHFTIPGLWEGLQDKIYADSTEATCCGTKVVRMVEEEDIGRAESELSLAIVEELKNSLRSSAPEASELGGEVFLSEITKRKVDVEPGEERTDFNISLTVKVTGIFYDRAAVNNLALQNINDLVGNEKRIVEFDPNRTTVSVERYSATEGIVRLGIEVKALAILNSIDSIFDKNRLVNLDKAGLEEYFNDFNSVESVRVNFRPPWLERAPRLKDHIEIKIEE